MPSRESEEAVPFHMKIILLAVLVVVILTITPYLSKAQDLSDCLIVEKGDSSATVFIKEECPQEIVTVLVSDTFGIVQSRWQSTKEKPARILHIKEKYSISFSYYKDGRASGYTQVY